MIRQRSGRWAVLLAALFFSAVHAQVEDRLKVCAACHGADGHSAIPGTPSLAAQPRIFLENYLVLTREGIAGTEVMRQLLKGVPNSEIVALAKHYSTLPSRSDASPADEKLFQKGKEVAAANRCAICHEPTYHGREQMPRLAGQREDYLAEAMLAYRQNRRPGGDTMMSAALYGIPEADFKAMAHYFARLK